MESILTFVSHPHWYNSPVNKPVLACLAKGTCTTCASKLRWRYKNLVLASLFIIRNNSKYLRVYIYTHVHTYTFVYICVCIYIYIQYA